MYRERCVSHSLPAETKSIVCYLYLIMFVFSLRKFVLCPLPSESFDICLSMPLLFFFDVAVFIIGFLERLVT